MKLNFVVILSLFGSLGVFSQDLILQDNENSTTKMDDSEYKIGDNDDKNLNYEEEDEDYDYTTGDVLEEVDEYSTAPPTLMPFDPVPQDRIVGGRNAAANQFPYQVALFYRGSFNCGGAIISSIYVATAAHCVTNQSRRGTITSIPASQLLIRAGSNIFNSGGTLRNVAQVKINPNYRNFNNDIALLRLATPLSFSNSIRPIPLANSELAAGTSVRVSGWGRVRYLGPISPLLKYNDLPAITSAQCRSSVSGVGNDILCLTHTRGNGACQGDSGGPAVAGGFLVGLTNFVVGRCGSTAPDGFAKISYHRAFIRQNSGV